MKYRNILFVAFLMLDFSNAEFLRGVNYGNRFIPEDWMTDDSNSIYGYHYGDTVQTPNDVERVSLCDVTDDRILRWLDDTVLEEDFVKMNEYGVKLLVVFAALVVGPDVVVGNDVPVTDRSVNKKV